MNFAVKTFKFWNKFFNIIGNFLEQSDFKIPTNKKVYNGTRELFKKTCRITAIKFNSFQRQSKEKAKLCLDGKTIMCFVHKLSTGHYNKSYYYYNNNKTGKTKNSLEK